MRQVLLVAIVLAGAATPASADDQVEFIKSKPPRFVFVSNVNAEKDLFKLIVPVEKNVPTTVEVDVTKDGKTVKQQVTVMKPVVEFTEQEFALSRLRVATAGGKEVPAADLAGLKGKAVLLATDEEGIHDLFLKLLGKDTYVVTPRPTKK